MDKEQVYDTEINPLMAQIIAICKRAGISMFATFAIPTESNPDLCCSTRLSDETGELAEIVARADAAVFRSHDFAAFTITRTSPEANP